MKLNRKIKEKLLIHQKKKSIRRIKICKNFFRKVGAYINIPTLNKIYELFKKETKNFKKIVLLPSTILSDAEKNYKFFSKINSKKK